MQNSLVRQATAAAGLRGLLPVALSFFPMPNENGFFISWVLRHGNRARLFPTSLSPPSSIPDRTGPDRRGRLALDMPHTQLLLLCCVSQSCVCVHVIHVANELLRVKVRQAHLDGWRVTNRSGVGMGAHGALFQPPSPSQWLEGHQSRRGDGGSWSTFPTAKPISMVGGSPTAVGG